MKKITILLCLLISLGVKSQSAYFRLYTNNRINLNPAFTGSDSTFNFSNSFVYNESNNRAFSTTIDNYFRGIRGGLSFNYTTWRFQPYQQIDLFRFAYAPHFETKSQWSIQPAIQFESVRSISTFGNNEFKQNFSALNVGILFYNKVAFIGIGLPYVTQTGKGGTIGDYILSRYYVFNIGLNMHFNSLTISPSIVINHAPGENNLLASLMFKYKWFVIGGVFQQPDFLMGSIGFQNKLFKLTYGNGNSVRNNYDMRNIQEFHLTLFIKHKKPIQIRTLRLI